MGFFHFSLVLIAMPQLKGGQNLKKKSCFVPKIEFYFEAYNVIFLDF